MCANRCSYAVLGTIDVYVVYGVSWQVRGCSGPPGEFEARRGWRLRMAVRLVERRCVLAVCAFRFSILHARQASTHIAYVRRLPTTPRRAATVRSVSV